MSEEQVIVLEKRADITTVDALHCQLESRLQAEEPLKIDASAVERLDTSVVQLLIAATKTRNASERVTQVISPSECFIQAADLLGAKTLLALQ